MRLLTLLLFIINFQSNGICQAKKMDNTLRFRMSLALKASNAKSAMKDYLRDSGFGDKYNSAFDALVRSGNDFYPQANPFSVAFELSVDQQIQPQTRLGLRVGKETATTAKGYDRYGTGTGLFGGTYSIGQFITLKHAAWYLSPFMGFTSKDGKKELLIGPSLDVHALSTEWEGFSTEKENQIRLGVIAQAALLISSRVEAFVAYRYSAKVKFAESLLISSGGDSSFLPSMKINFSHFRLGLAYQFYVES